MHCSIWFLTFLPKIKELRYIHSHIHIKKFGLQGEEARRDLVDIAMYVPI